MILPNAGVLDKATFPRNKVCGGWITLPVFDELEIDPAKYAEGRILQPITGFRTSVIGDRRSRNGLPQADQVTESVAASSTITY